MSEQTIYNALRSGGLSPAGACAMMGNMYCESSMKSNIVETRCPLSGSDYTWNVDQGIITKQEFCNDSFGYGLCQWTFHSRKEELYDFAMSKRVSIGNEKMQCEFCIWELKNHFENLYKYLCETDDLPKATERICAEYEQPAVNNFAARINAAQKFYNQLAIDDSGCTEDACPIEPPEECTVNVRVLRKGDLGRDVFLLQCGLDDMGFDCGKPDGDFGTNTQGAVSDLRRIIGLDPNGIADQAVWQTILQKG